MHLQARNVSKTFVLHQLGGKRVLAFEDISFDVERGSFLGIAGQSGSGKSSLLKSLFRTYLVDSGSIVLNQQAGSVPVELTRASDDVVLDVREREMGFVSQFLRPIPRVRALDLAARPLIRSGVAADEARERVAGYFDRLRLPRELWDGLPILFSGGEQQRVNIARALAARPPLLLLDEPTSALDEGLQQVVVELLLEARAEGTTMVGVMHDAGLLQRLADSVISMQGGRIVATSNPGSLTRAALVGR